MVKSLTSFFLQYSWLLCTSGTTQGFRKSQIRWVRWCRGKGSSYPGQSAGLDSWLEAVWATGRNQKAMISEEVNLLFVFIYIGKWTGNGGRRYPLYLSQMSERMMCPYGLTGELERFCPSGTGYMKQRGRWGEELWG